MGLGGQGSAQQLFQCSRWQAGPMLCLECCQLCPELSLKPACRRPLQAWNNTAPSPRVSKWATTRSPYRAQGLRHPMAGCWGAVGAGGSTSGTWEGLGRAGPGRGSLWVAGTRLGGLGCEQREVSCLTPPRFWRQDICPFHSSWDCGDGWRKVAAVRGGGGGS